MELERVEKIGDLNNVPYSVKRSIVNPRVIGTRFKAVSSCSSCSGSGSEEEDDAVRVGISNSNSNSGQSQQILKSGTVDLDLSPSGRASLVET